jgi:hypothetical protein
MTLSTEQFKVRQAVIPTHSNGQFVMRLKPINRLFRRAALLTHMAGVLPNNRGVLDVFGAVIVAGRFRPSRANADCNANRKQTGAARMGTEANTPDTRWDNLEHLPTVLTGHGHGGLLPCLNLAGTGTELRGSVETLGVRLLADGTENRGAGLFRQPIAGAGTVYSAR